VNVHVVCVGKEIPGKVAWFLGVALHIGAVGRFPGRLLDVDGAYARGCEGSFSTAITGFRGFFRIVEIPCLLACGVQCRSSFSLSKFLFCNAFPHAENARNKIKSDSPRSLEFYPRVVHIPIHRDFLICRRCVLCVWREAGWVILRPYLWRADEYAGES